MTNLSFDFTGRTVLVTGAARGVGKEIGRCFARSGARVYLVDVDADELAVAADEFGASALVADVGSTDDVAGVIDRIIDDSGRIDVLVNNAGILRDGVVWRLSDDDFDAVMSTHAGGTFRMTRAVAECLRRQRSGRIINVTSYTGLHGNVGQSNYAMAKAGIIGFTKTTAKELARYGVTVNAISPNARTRMIESVPHEKLAELTAAIPLARFAEAWEMTAAVAFLASDEAAYITGAVLPVDGGLSI